MRTPTLGRHDDGGSSCDGDEGGRDGGGSGDDGNGGDDDGSGGNDGGNDDSGGGGGDGDSDDVNFFVLSDNGIVYRFMCYAMKSNTSHPLRRPKTPLRRFIEFFPQYIP